MNRNIDSVKITVVVPVHNATRTLRQCLQALKKQTDSNYEVMVVDDCSNDGSFEICKESGFKVIRLTANKGQAVARNEGVKEAKGQIIAFTDSDVIVPSHWLGKYRQLLAKNQDIDMICSGYDGNIGDDKPALFAFYECLYRRLKIPMYISASASCNCVIYKEVFDEVGGYPEYYINPKKCTINQKAVATSEDSELGFLLSEKGKKILWSRDNPVRHYFRNSWKGYLMQQIGFSRHEILSFFKFPKKIYCTPIYSGEKIAFQLAIVLVMLLVLFGLLFGWLNILTAFFIEIFCLLIFYIFHRKFIYYLKSNMKNCSYLQLFFWLIVSRITWLCGVALGVKDGFLMLCYNYGKKDTCYKK